MKTFDEMISRGGGFRDEWNVGLDELATAQKNFTTAREQVEEYRQRELGYTATIAKLQGERDEAKAKCCDTCESAMRNMKEADLASRAFGKERDEARAERDRLRKFLGGEVRALLNKDADNWHERARVAVETIDALLPPPATDAARVRVFGNESIRFAWKGGVCWAQDTCVPFIWRLRTPASIIKGPRNADEFKSKCCFDSDRELTPAEVTALLAQYPLPGEAAKPMTHEEAWKELTTNPQKGDRWEYRDTPHRTTDWHMDRATPIGMEISTPGEMRPMTRENFIQKFTVSTTCNVKLAPRSPNPEAAKPAPVEGHEVVRAWRLGHEYTYVQIKGTSQLYVYDRTSKTWNMSGWAFSDIQSNPGVFGKATVITDLAEISKLWDARKAGQAKHDTRTNEQFIADVYRDAEKLEVCVRNGKTGTEWVSLTALAKLLEGVTV